MIRSLPRWLAGAALVVSGSPARATVWHIDPAAQPGGDGSEQRPLNSLVEGLTRATSGDQLRLAAGSYQQTLPVTVNGMPRAAVLPLPDGVVVEGAGRGATVLDPVATGTITYGITAVDVGNGTQVRDLSVRGPCFQGINLRNASPILERVDVRTDLVGASSTGLDARDGSFPTLLDCTIDGGHSAVFVEFGSGGLFERCVLGGRPNETMAVIASAPELRACVLGGAGRDTIVLAQGSQPRLTGCTIHAGARWTVRVAGGYTPGATVDLSGNLWDSRDPVSLADGILDAADDPLLQARVEVLPLGGTVTSTILSFGALKARDATPAHRSPQGG